MRHRKKRNKLNRSRAHTKATLASLANSVIKNESITTTITKAKKTKPVVDKLITLGKKGDLHSRRIASKIVQDKEILKILFDQVASRFKKRNGGYTRVIRKGQRAGDDATMAILELVNKKGKVTKKKTEKPSKKTITKEKKKEEKVPEEERREKKGFVGGLRDLFKKKK